MKDMKASNLTYVLVGACALLVAAVIGGGIFAGSLLQKKSVEATHAAIDADVSDGATTRVLELQKYLADNAGVVSDTSQIAGSIGQYQQNTVVATVSEYARKAGVSITGFNFGTGTAGAAGAAAASSGETTMTLGSPVPYRNFLVFLNLLENGVMPVTVTSALISPDSSNPANVSVSEMKIKVTD